MTAMKEYQYKKMLRCCTIQKLMLIVYVLKYAERVHPKRVYTLLVYTVKCHCGEVSLVQ